MKDSWSAETTVCFHNIVIFFVVNKVKNCLRPSQTFFLSWVTSLFMLKVWDKKLCPQEFNQLTIWWEIFTPGHPLLLLVQEWPRWISAASSTLLARQVRLLLLLYFLVLFYLCASWAWIFTIWIKFVFLWKDVFNPNKKAVTFLRFLNFCWCCTLQDL